MLFSCKEHICKQVDSLWHQINVNRQKIRPSNVKILHSSNQIAKCARNCAIQFKLFLCTAQIEARQLNNLKEWKQIWFY